MAGSIPELHKRQHKRAASSVPPTSVPQKLARRDCDVSAKKTSYAASPLERLPTEILEMIFLYSLNLSLPRASPALGKCLASNHMKTNLFLLIFPSEGPDLRNMDYLLGILGTEDSIGNLQSDILALKWATPAFVRGLTEPFMVSTIVSVFRKHGLGWFDPGKQVELKGTTEEARMDNVYEGVLDATMEVNVDVVSRFYKRAVTGGKFETGIHSHTDFMEWLWRSTTASRDVRMHIGFHEGQLLLLGLDVGESPLTESLAFHSRMVSCAAGFRIPAKLLHGPWSDDKCTELLRISRGGGRIDQTGSTMDEEVADTGLREAIIEDNQMAIIVLVGSITMYRTVASAFGETYCPTCCTIWLSPERTHGKHCEQHIHRFCVGLAVHTEHVKLALDKDCSRPVLYTLLHAMKIDIDWADTELTAWAVQKKKEDDERGQWLLDRLGSSNMARYEEDFNNVTELLEKRREENAGKNNLPRKSDVND